MNTFYLCVYQVNTQLRTNGEHISMHSYWEPPSTASLLLLLASAHQLWVQANGASVLRKRTKTTAFLQLPLKLTVLVQYFSLWDRVKVQFEAAALNRWSVTFSVIIVTGQCNSLSGQREDTNAPGGEVCERDGFGGCLKTDGSCQPSPALATPGRVRCWL